MKALGLLPFPTASARAATRRALERRLTAATTGQCPCGAKVPIVPTQGLAQAISVIHENDCVAGQDHKLRQAAKRGEIIDKWVIYHYPSGKIDQIVDTLEQLRQAAP